MPDLRDQRVRSRVRLDLPLRVRQIGPPRSLVEITRTVDVSRNGVLFRTRQPYDLRGTVWVTMPFNASAVAPDPEFPGTVVRVDRRPDGNSEVALQFHSSRADQIAPAPPPSRPLSHRAERRLRNRVRMALPIRVRHESAAEESITYDVSRSGVLFKTARPYPVGQMVLVTMPYQRGEHAEEVPARVVRIVEREQFRGAALHFAGTAETRSYSRPF